MAVIAGPDSALVYSWEGGEAQLVVDGKPAAQQDWLPGGPEPLMPGPKPGQFWLREDRRNDVVLKPVTLRGTPAPGRSIILPPGFWVHSSDQRGNVIATGIGGEYLVDHAGLRRITTGALVAVGPSRFLKQVCDERARCRHEVVDRSTGKTGPLGGDFKHGQMFIPGLISANGQTAAVLTAEPDPEPQLFLLDLRTGATRRVDIEVGEIYGSPRMAWSPDGRWLVVASERGLAVVDPATAEARGLGVELSAVEAVAVRE